MTKVYVSIPYSGTIPVSGTLQVCVDVPQGVDPIKFVREKGARFVRKEGEVVVQDDQQDCVSIDYIGTDEPDYFWQVSKESRV